MRTTFVVQYPMGFSSAKRALLTALEAGNFQHEAREVLSEKNLLAVGDISVGEVIGIVRRTRGQDYSVSPHHWDPDVEVHVFRATVEETRWFVKAYSLEGTGGTAVFISIHR
jgi:hypothetical protein